MSASTVPKLPPSGRLVAVLSTENAGSSLVTAILGGSPAVVAPPELHLFRYPGFDEWLEQKPIAMPSLAWLMEKLGQPAEAHELRRRFAGRSTAEVYRELLELCGPGRVLIDKTPAYARDTAILRRLEEFQPRYVWITRHPLGVVASNIEGRAAKLERRLAQARTPARRLALSLRRAWGRLRLGRRGFVRHRLAYWRDVNARLERWAAEVGEERVYRLGYERLVRAPEAEVQRLCEVLSIEFCPAMLQPGRNVPDALTWGIGNEKVNVHTSIERRLADRWRETLDESVMDPATRELRDRLDVPPR